MAYTSIENSAEIQELKRQYETAQAAGASKAELNAIHQAAEALRRAAGYESTDATGEVFRASSKGSSIKSAITGKAVDQKTIIGAYDPAQYSGGSGTINRYAAYIVAGLLLLAILRR